MKSFRVLSLAFVLGACGGDLGRLPVGPSATPLPEQYLEVRESAFAAARVVELAQRSVTIPFPGGSTTIGYENGWYLVKVVMFGSQRSLKFQFQDGQGQAMHLYDPHRTRAIRLLTLTEDSLGLRRFDLTVRGVEFSSDEFRISGNGRLVNGDQDWDFFANNIVLAKAGNPYPLRGEAVLETEHSSGSRSSLHFKFNGSRQVDGRFDSGSVSITFTLDLVSLEVDFVEPTP